MFNVKSLVSGLLVSVSVLNASPANAQRLQANERDFVHAVMRYAPSSVSQHDVVKFGYSLCRQYDAGVDFQEVLNNSLAATIEANREGRLDESTTDRAVRFFGTSLGSSVRYLCPEHSKRFENFLNIRQRGNSTR